MKTVQSKAMSGEQLSALLAKLKEDAGLREKLKSASDLDAAAALALEAGLDVSKEDWLRYQARKTLELSDHELEVVAGGQKEDRPLNNSDRCSINCGLDQL